VRQRHAARRRYALLSHAMKRAEANLDPLLSALRDQVLYLKHPLNARAIVSLQGERTSIETHIHVLIQEREAVISEADAFIKTIGST
jgi:hypothetical protein